MTHAAIEADARRLIRLRESMIVGRVPRDSATLPVSWEGQQLAETTTALKTFSVRELAADPDLMRPPDFLVGGLLPRGCLALLYGAPKSGKTTLAAHIAAAVALGRPFLGRPAEAHPVLYADFERPRRLTLVRLMEPLAEAEPPE